MHSNLVPSLLAILPCLVSALDPLVAPSTLEHTLIEERQTPSNACATGVHVIVASGEGTGGDNYSLFGTLITNITSMIPGTNNYLLPPYNLNLTFPQFTGAQEQVLRQYIAQYTQSCPDTYIVLAGYSAGAVTSMNALCGATTVPPWNATQPIWDDYNIIASVAYGDELYQGLQPYDKSNCTNNAPKGYRNSSACTPIFKRMASYCFSDDPFCCSGGDNAPSHQLYPAVYDVEAAKFVRHQWRRAKKRARKHHRS